MSIRTNVGQVSFAFGKGFRSLSALWFGSLCGAGLAFLTQIVLARALEPSGYGAFAATLATIALVAPLAGFGIRGLWLRAFGMEGWGAQRWIRPSLQFIALSTLCVCGLVVAWAEIGPHDKISRILFLMLLPTIISQASLEMVSGKLQIEARYGALAMWQLMPHATRFFVVIILVAGVFGEVSTVYIAASYGLVALLFTAIGLPQLLRLSDGKFILAGHHQRPSNGTMTTPSMRHVVMEAWPFGAAGILYLIYFQSDVILIRYLVGETAAGVYNVAFVILAAIYLIPSALFQKFLLPKLHRWAAHDEARFLAAYRLGSGLMLFSGIGACLVLIGLAGPLVNGLFGSAYSEAVVLLMVLAAAVPFRFVATSVGASLVTGDNMRLKVRYMALVAVLNVILNLLLIPRWGVMGAAIATVASELTLLLLYLLAARWHVFGIDAWRGWGTAVLSLARRRDV